MRHLVIYLAFLFVPIFCIGFALNAGQDMNWDLQNYHLYAPYAFINDRHLFDLSPAGLQSYFNPLLYLNYLWLVNHTSPQVTASILALVQSLNFFLVYVIALQLLSNTTPAKKYVGFALALMGVFSAGFLSEIGTSQFDNVVSLFVLSALFLILYSINNSTDKHRKLYFFFGGLLAGIGCAIKLVVGIYALGLFAAIYCLRKSFTDRFVLSCIYSSGVVVGILLFGGFWYLFMFENFGNPLFPLFNSYFGGELAQVGSNRDIRFSPSSMLDYLAYPIVFTLNPLRVSEIAYTQFNWLLVYVAIVVFLTYKLSVAQKENASHHVLSPDKRLFLGFFIASYLLWLVLFGIYRYLISLDLLIPLVIYIIVSNMFSKPIYKYVTLVGLATITLFNSSGAADWGRAGWSDQVYKTEIPAGFEKASGIILVGQPLAWLIPAFDAPKPFIQIAPNFPISTAYLNKVREHMIDGKEMGFIYNPLTINLAAEVPEDAIEGFFPQGFEFDPEAPRTVLQLYFGMNFEDLDCQPFTANVGLTDFDFQFCLQRD